MTGKVVEGIHVSGEVDLDDIVQPGAFQFQTLQGDPIGEPESLPDGTELRLAFHCPGEGCGRVHINITKSPVDTGTGWQWDGNVYGPTLTPDISCGSCAWHGQLVKGKFIPCQD